MRKLPKLIAFYSLLIAFYSLLKTALYNGMIVRRLSAASALLKAVVYNGSIRPAQGCSKDLPPNESHKHQKDWPSFLQKDRPAHRKPNVQKVLA